jgi:magnesium chelatase family protein
VHAGIAPGGTALRRKDHHQMTEVLHDIQPVMVPAAARTGADVRLVGIRAMPAADQRTTSITGLPADAAWTTRDRIYAAINNSAGCRWPQQPVTLSVEPDALPVGDSGLDLAFAVALLAADGQIPRHRVAGTLCLAELGLDGALRTIPEVTARLAAAHHADLPDAIVAPGNLTEATLATPSQVCTARTLTGLVAGLRGDAPLRTPQAWPTAPPQPDADLADLPAGHTLARRILEVAAAGGHHVLMSGPPDGAAMLAERLPGLLPDLDPITAAEVAAAHRQAGTLPPDAIVRHRPPWQAAHHSISPIDLTGTPRRPGTVGLAHGGVLYCPDADELAGPARDVLCGVLDQSRITMLSARAQATYPARVQLLLSAHGCPPAPTGCDRPPAAHRQARDRMARLSDRVDIHTTLPPTPAATGTSAGESTAVVAARVAAARAAAAARWAGQPWATNAGATPAELRAALARVPANRFAPLQYLLHTGVLGQRGSMHILRLSFTLADLSGHGRPTADDVVEAIRLRNGQES